MMLWNWVKKQIPEEIRQICVNILGPDVLSDCREQYQHTWSRRACTGSRQKSSYMCWQQHWGFHLDRLVVWNVIDPAGNQSRPYSSFSTGETARLHCSLVQASRSNTLPQNPSAHNRLNVSLIAWFKKLTYLLYLQKPSKHLQHIIHLPVMIQPTKPMPNPSAPKHLPNLFAHHSNHWQMQQTQECKFWHRSVSPNRLHE